VLEFRYTDCLALSDSSTDQHLGLNPSSSQTASHDAIRVLVADDERELVSGIARMLKAHGMSVATAHDGLEALEALEAGPVDVALVDLMMPRLGGLEVLQKVRARFPDTEVVMMTAFADVETAVKATQAGAYNFLTKPFRTFDEVSLVIRQAAERRKLKALAENLERRLAATIGGMIGSSRVMKEVYRKAMDVASTKVTVLILGESGTGKELTARAIHENSNRNGKPFIAVNCSAIPEGVLESELFGHMKGAFTNATSNRTGLFEAASTGTIFLDEVGDLPQQAQVKLLRVLQEGEVKRVGSNETRVIDTRVIAATNVDLRKKIDAGTFREDLYYRLNVVAIHLPPLRHRREDIPALAYHFLRKHAARLGREVKEIAPEAMALLMRQPWKGNVRELENAIERAVVFSKDPVSQEDLGLGLSQDGVPQVVVPIPISSDAAGAALPLGLPEMPYRDAKEQALAAFEHHYFTALRERTGANVSEAARQAGLDRSNFRRAIKRAGVAWRDDADSA
jgi:two-component system response regulator HydG